MIVVVYLTLYHLETSKNISSNDLCRSFCIQHFDCTYKRFTPSILKNKEKDPIEERGIQQKPPQQKIINNTQAIL